MLCRSKSTIVSPDPGDATAKGKSVHPRNVGTASKSPASSWFGDDGGAGSLALDRVRLSKDDDAAAANGIGKPIAAGAHSSCEPVSGATTAEVTRDVVCEETAAVFGMLLRPGASSPSCLLLPSSSAPARGTLPKDDGFFRSGSTKGSSSPAVVGSLDDAAACVLLLFASVSSSARVFSNSRVTRFQSSVFFFSPSTAPLIWRCNRETSSFFSCRSRSAALSFFSSDFLASSARAAVAFKRGISSCSVA
mmetsp:Transcript_21392/g.69232  ORF Transcript_21392/g.69232 Transcript_21392/m.69232 type:complete len:249 (+) Transcript_21392:173-919(+)